MGEVSSHPRANDLLPLAGTRVLEIGSAVSASFAAKLLGDLGAEVVKIEPLSGDPLRRHGPFMAGDGPDVSAFFGYLNAGKRCIAIDPVAEGARDIVASLLGRSALVLWVGDDDILAPLKDLVEPGRPCRPATVMFSPFGMTGARAGRAGSDFVAQHSGGLAYHQAYPVTDPEMTPPAGAADREAEMIVGLVAANAGLWAMMSSGQGEAAPFVDLSSEDVFAYMLVDALADLKEGRLSPSRRRLPNQGITIAGGLVWFLPCAEGAIMVSPREDHQWARWVELMGNPAWANDVALCGSRGARTTHSGRLQVLMAEWSQHQEAQATFQKAQAARVACFPISTAADLVRNQQLHARQFFETLSAAGKQDVPVPGLPFAMRSSTGATLPRNRRRILAALEPHGGDAGDARVEVSADV